MFCSGCCSTTKYTLTKTVFNISSLFLIEVIELNNKINSPIFVPRTILSSTLGLFLARKKREVKTTESYLLSPGQTIKTFQHNISQHSGWPSICWPNSGQTRSQRLNETYRNIIAQGCDMLRAFGHSTGCDALRHVGCFCLKFKIGQIFHTTFVDVA